jgi:hypothetical protein
MGQEILEIVLVETESYPGAGYSEEFVAIFDPMSPVREGRCFRSWLVYDVEDDKMMDMRSAPFDFEGHEITHWFRNASDLYNTWVKYVNGDNVLEFLRKTYAEYAQMFSARIYED